jgi:hypothetical protein
MNPRGMLGMVTAAVGLSVGALLVGSQSAGAATSGPLTCSSPDQYVYCTETFYPGPVAWSYNFSSISADYGLSSATFLCGAQGRTWVVSINLGPGVVNGPDSYSVSGTCSGPHQPPPNS